MRKRLVDTYTDPATGVRYGLRGDPADFALAQSYTHDHVNATTRDFLMKGATVKLVSGFDYTLAGALSLSIASGRAYDSAGLGYETITDPAGQPAVVTLEAADPANPRIDLIYILLEPNVQELPVPRTFRRLLTSAEIIARQDPYLPENFTRFSEEHTKATVLVRKGTPAGAPVAPATNANEVALYEVRVNANAATLVSGNVTDKRHKIRSLNDALNLIDAINASPALANLSEAIDDRVDALIPDSSYFTKVYNDAGNILTLDADLAAFDARYVNVTGDTLTGKLAVHDGSSFAPTETTGLEAQVDKAGVDVSSVFGYAHVQTDAKVAKGVAGRGGVGLGNSSSAYGGHFEAFANPGGNTLAGQFIGVYGRGVADSQTSGSQAFACGVYGTAVKNQVASTAWAGYFLGSVNITGSISKGGGTFHIDHPLDPENKDLIFGFTEAPEHLIILRVQKPMLSATLDATVNLDTYFGLTAGTIEALCQDLRVESVYVPEGGAPVDVQLDGNVIDILKPDAAARTIRITLMGARKDPFIMASPHVNGAGQLVPQQLKPVPTAAQLALLEDAEVTLPEGDVRIGHSEMEVVPVLIGKQGFPRHAEVHSSELPKRQVTYVEEP